MSADDRAVAEGSRARSGKAVRIGRTAVGRGVFAQRNYVPDQLVGELEGTIIDDPDYEGSDYAMDMGDTRCLEPASPFRFVNHSCEPNCRLQWFNLAASDRSGPRRRGFVVALEHIRPGEELTIDYAWPAHAAIRCRCGAPTCRGWIVSEQELMLVDEPPC
jgi:hypothetical protein